MKKTDYNITKSLIIFALPILLLSGCLLQNNSQDVIKITSENISGKKIIKVNKTLSLSTGINLLEADDIDGAIKFFKEYEDFYSQNPKYYYYFGQAYFRKGLYIKAANSFEKALALDKKKYDLLFNIAEAYEKANIKNKASENYINYVFRTNNSSKNIEIRNKLNKLAETGIGNDVIGRISLSDRADVVKNTTVGIMQVFNPDTPTIFASVELINAKNSDIIRAKWNFINHKGEIIPVNFSEFNTEGSKTVLLSIKSPVAGWPTGTYEMQVFLNGIKNSSLKFYIF